MKDHFKIRHLTKFGTVELRCRPPKPYKLSKFFSFPWYTYKLINIVMFDPVSLK